MVEAEEEGTIEDQDLAMDWSRMDMQGAFPKAYSQGFLIKHRFGSLDTGMQPDSSESLHISMSYKHGSVALGLREYRTLRTPKLPNRITLHSLPISVVTSRKSLESAIRWSLHVAVCTHRRLGVFLVFRDLNLCRLGLCLVDARG